MRSKLGMFQRFSYLPTFVGQINTSYDIEVRHRESSLFGGGERGYGKRKMYLKTFSRDRLEGRLSETNANEGRHTNGQRGK